MKLRIPARFRGATLESLDAGSFAPLLEYAKNLREEVAGGRGILAAGPPGVGKTWALVALTQFAMASSDAGTGPRLRSYEFVTSPDLIKNLGVFKGNVDGFRDQSWERTYKTVPWLVINDLGKEYRGGKMKEQAAFILGWVLRARSEKMLPTHLTTNLSGKDIIATYGESIASLLTEMTKLVTVTSRDRRGP